jgi:predicted dehydrogenase
VLPALAQSRVVRVAGICTRNAHNGRIWAKDYGCAYFATPDAMFRDARVDVVYVTTPTGLHFAHGCQVLEAGKHLWCEKPMTTSYTSTRDLFDAAERKGLMAVSGLMYKYHPQFAAIKRLLAEQAIGDVKTLSIRFGMPRLDEPTFRDDPALGGGALLDLACYPLSAVYQLLHSPPSLVAGYVGTAPASAVDTDGWTILAHGDILVDIAWGMDRAYQNKLQIWGSRGLLVADRVFTKEDHYDSTVLVSDHRGGAPSVLPSGSASSLGAMVEAFVSNFGRREFLDAERRETEWCALMTEEIAQYRQPLDASPRALTERPAPT